MHFNKVPSGLEIFLVSWKLPCLTPEQSAYLTTSELEVPHLPRPVVLGQPTKQEALQSDLTVPFSKKFNILIFIPNWKGTKFWNIQILWEMLLFFFFFSHFPPQHISYLFHINVISHDLDQSYDIVCSKGSSKYVITRMPISLEAQTIIKNKMTYLFKDISKLTEYFFRKALECWNTVI